MTDKDQGKLVYTTRGFLQDAQDAMRGDILRALIELITNADDAYNGKGGEIFIQVMQAEGPFEWKISVHDKDFLVSWGYSLLRFRYNNEIWLHNETGSCKVQKM